MKQNIRQFNHSNKALLITVCIFALSLTGCGSDSKQPNLTKKGLWERVGYGDIFKVDSHGKATKLYQFTRETCLDASPMIDEQPLIQVAFDTAIFSNKKSTLEVENIDVSIFKVSLQRLDKLPQSCLDDRLIKTATANNMFDHFWHNFNDYYAFFDKRDVDWAYQYAEYQPQVNEDTSDDDLFEILAQMVTPLKDGHVNLGSTNDSFNPELPSKAFLEIASAFPQQNDFDDFDEFIESVYLRFHATIDSYLDADSIKSHKGASGEVIAKRGTINHTIGYLQINEMDEFVDGSLSEEIKVVRAFMNETMVELQDTQGIIIDIRNNGGGSDSIGLVIASYFTDEKKKVASQKVRYWAGETETVNAIMEPANESPYLQPVIVIASKDSVSAAESFLLMMKSLPQVTLIGENSNGMFSNMLNKGLPKGWEFSLSNEVYYDAEGINYEAVGVPPQEEVTVFSLSDIDVSKDKAIERAVQMLGQ